MTASNSKSLCQRLDQPLIVTPCRSDSNPQGDWPQREIQRAGGRGENKQPDGQYE